MHTNLLPTTLFQKSAEYRYVFQMCSSDQLPSMTHPSLMDSHSAFSPMSAAAATVCTAAAAMTSFHHHQQQHNQTPRFLTAPIHHYLQPQLHHLTNVHPHAMTYQSHHLNPAATSPRSPSPGSDKTSYSDWERVQCWQPLTYSAVKT